MQLLTINIMVQKINPKKGGKGDADDLKYASKFTANLHALLSQLFGNYFNYGIVVEIKFTLA